MSAYDDMPIIEARFWAKVARVENACWAWTGARYAAKHGYGCININGRRFLAHRLSLTLKLGRPIADGLFACHTCDVKLCVNPDHLYEGTHAQNMRDVRERSRAAYGERSGRRRLSEAEIVEIIERCRSGAVTQRRLATEYGVSQSQIQRIATGQNWARTVGPLLAAAGGVAS